jgi:hypothetical protein
MYAGQAATAIARRQAASEKHSTYLRLARPSRCSSARSSASALLRFVTRLVFSEATMRG